MHTADLVRVPRLLNALLVRMIAGELAGQPIEPRREDILRTVGNPQK